MATTKCDTPVINEINSVVLYLNTTQGIRHMIIIPNNHWAEKGTIKCNKEDNGKKTMTIEIPVEKYFII